METIEINYKYKPGTRLYRVTYGELKYYDVECVNINLSLNRDEPLITYQLRVNNSSGNRDTTWDFEIDKYYSLTPEEALRGMTIKHTICINDMVEDCKYNKFNRDIPYIKEKIIIANYEKAAVLATGYINDDWWKRWSFKYFQCVGKWRLGWTSDLIISEMEDV